MATIFPSGERVLSGPFDFEWEDARSGGPNSPNVYLSGVDANYAGLAGGEQFNMSRGSTAQINQVVTVAAPGGGPGTKTRAELITDINAVFGLAGGAPTEFAFTCGTGGIRCIDNTVGPNTALAAMLDYTAVGEAAKDALYAMIGFNANVTRDITAVASTTRTLVGNGQLDDRSMLSSNFFSLPAGTKKLLLEVAVGNLAVFNSSTSPPAVFSLAWSDGSALYEPGAGLLLLSELEWGLSGANPAQVVDQINLFGGQPSIMVPVKAPASIQAVPPAVVPAVWQRTQMEVIAPTMNASRVRAIALSCFDLFRSGSRHPTKMQLRAWAVG